MIYMTDIEIASSCKMKLIKDVAKSVGIDELIENYGNYKAKINYDKINKSKNVVAHCFNHFWKAPSGSLIYDNIGTGAINCK